MSKVVSAVLVVREGKFVEKPHDCSPSVTAEAVQMKTEEEVGFLRDLAESSASEGMVSSCVYPLFQSCLKVNLCVVNGHFPSLPCPCYEEADLEFSFSPFCGKHHCF